MRFLLFLALFSGSAAQISLVVQVGGVPATLNSTDFQNALGGGVSVADMSYGLLARPCPVGGYCFGGLALPCPVATYQPQKNQRSPSACLPCAGGTYGPSTWLSSCLVCPAGSFCPAGASGPVACGAGTYSKANSSACVACPAGSFCPAGASGPVACGVGTYGPSSGLSACLPCVAGVFCPYAGMSLFVGCPAGSFCVPGATAAVVCAAGFYSRANASVCSMAPAGSFSPGNASVATPCANGTYAPSAGLSACPACPAGSFCNASAAIPCPAGTYRNIPGGYAAAQCAPCPSGQFCLSGSVLGTACSPVSYANVTGLSACVPCAAGTYNPTNSTGRSIACPLCLAGSYCPTAVQILPCPNNTNSSAGGSSILNCVCNPGYVCGYYKTISVTFSLANVSLSDFNSDVNLVQTNFIASVASVAGVDVSSVTIVSVSAMTGTSRRLMRLESNQPLKRIELGGLSVVVHIDPPSSPHLRRLQSHSDYDGHEILR